MTHEATLTTLARYKALQYAKAAHRHAGGKPQSITTACCAHATPQFVCCSECRRLVDVRLIV